MFIFFKEKALMHYIVNNMDKIEELKGDKLIGYTEWYGEYYNKKARDGRSHKFSDMVTSNSNTLRIIEVRWNINKDLVRKSIQAMKGNQFYKNIELVFIGTKISDKLRNSLNSEPNIKVIILKEVKYVKGYIDKEIELPHIKKDIEIEIFNYINKQKIKKDNHIYKDEYKFNFYGYTIDNERKKLVFNMKFDNGYILRTIVNEEKNEKTYRYSGRKEVSYFFHKCYEIIVQESNVVRVIGLDIEYVYNLLENAPKGFLDNKNVKDLIQSIVYAKTKKWIH